MMRTLFLHPPSFDGFDGGAGSRYQARREIRSFWYPTWLAQPAALVASRPSRAGGASISLLPSGPLVPAPADRRCQSDGCSVPAIAAADLATGRGLSQDWKRWSPVTPST